VHWSFNEFIESTKCIKKLTLNIPNEATLETITDVMNNSDRQYSKIKISQFSKNITPLLQVLMFHFGKLTSITLMKIDFENINDFVMLMRHMESTVEHIHIDQVYVIKNNSFQTTSSHCDLKFKGLKTLITKCCHASIYNEIFINCCNLTQFIIKAGNQISLTALNAIKTILENNVNVTILGIHFNIFNLLFSENFSSKIKFKLNEFHAQDIYRIAGDQSIIRTNLHNFLMTQMSIVSLTIDNWMGVEVLKLIFHMPALKCLILKGFHFSEPTIDWNEISLQQNETIETLYYHDISGNAKIIQKIIDAAVKVKQLTLYFATNDIVNHVNFTGKQLKSLVVEKCV
jgi:hypothetical protein